MILFIAVCDTSRLEQMVGTFVRNFCSTTPTSGTGPPGGTLRVGGHISAAFNNPSKSIHAADKIEGGTEGEAPPIGKGGNEIAPNMSWENTLGAGERWRYD